MSGTGDQGNGWLGKLARFVAANGVSFAFGILSIGLALYIYHSQSVTPQIAWSMSKQTVFDYHSASPSVHVTDTDGKPITSDMYADQFTIWNSGNSRFDDVDQSTVIREPLTFRLVVPITQNPLSEFKAAFEKLSNGVPFKRDASVEQPFRIISAAIISAKNDTDGGWEIKHDAQSATMTWRHFDPGAAAKILILYTGDSNTSVEPKIVAAGLNGLAQVSLNPNGSVSDTVGGLLGVFTVAFGFFGILGAMNLFLPSQWLVRLHIMTATDRPSAIFFFSGSVIAVIVWLAYRFWFPPITPPTF